MSDTVAFAISVAGTVLAFSMALIGVGVMVFAAVKSARNRMLIRVSVKRLDDKPEQELVVERLIIVVGQLDAEYIRENIEQGGVFSRN
jgi:hypothetical protein